VLLPTLRTNQIQSVAKRKTSWACRKGGGGIEFNLGSSFAADAALFAVSFAFAN